MKTKEEIEQLVYGCFGEKEWDNISTNAKLSLIQTYTQCQEDMADKWISVKDELPPINVPVLCYQKNKHCQFRKMVLGFDGKEFRDFYNGDDDDILFEDGNYLFITHWMSLPNRPLNKQDNERA